MDQNRKRKKKQHKQQTTSQAHKALNDSVYTYIFLVLFLSLIQPNAVKSYRNIKMYPMYVTLIKMFIISWKVYCCRKKSIYGFISIVDKIKYNLTKIIWFK